jgi:hypothetical protein
VGADPQGDVAAPATPHGFGNVFVGKRRHGRIGVYDADSLVFNAYKSANRGGRRSRTGTALGLPNARLERDRR